MFSPNSRLICTGSQSLYLGKTTCGNEMFNTTLELVSTGTPTMSWAHRSRNINTYLDSPFEFFADNSSTPLAWYPRRYSLAVPGYGSSVGLRYPQINDSVLVAPDDQGISVQLELLFSNVTRSLFWDPTISLSVLLPDPGLAPEMSSPENGATLVEAQAVNLAIAIGVPVAAIALVAIVGLLVFSPAVRRKLFPSEAAIHEIRRRQMASGPIQQGPVSSQAADPASPKQTTNSDWQSARPSLSTVNTAAEQAV
jgi:hypothetical protein